MCGHVTQAKMLNISDDIEALAKIVSGGEERRERGGLTVARQDVRRVPDLLTRLSGD